MPLPAKSAAGAERPILQRELPPDGPGLVVRRGELVFCYAPSSPPRCLLLENTGSLTVPLCGWRGSGAIFPDRLLWQPGGQGTLNCGDRLLAGSPASSSGQPA